VDVDGVAEFPFVVREVLSSSPGAHAALREALAISGVTLSCLQGADRQADQGCDEYWCARLMRPMQHRIAEVDCVRYDANYVAADADGLFAWMHYIVLRPHAGGVFGPGVPGVVADFAYVIDASLGAATVFDSSKVDWVATVIVDGRLGASNQLQPQTEAHEDAEHRVPASGGSFSPDRSPRELLSQQGFEVSPEQFSQTLDDVLAMLAGLSGSAVGALPRPREVKARKQTRPSDLGPSYSFTGTEVRYQTVHPIRGQLSVATANPEEALYWMIDDAARSLAWSWAERTPASRTLDRDRVQWLLAMPMWLSLVTALDVEWGRMTRARISELRNLRDGSPQQATAREQSR
jgi:hypothetical protein